MNIPLIITILLELIDLGIRTSENNSAVLDEYIALQKKVRKALVEEANEVGPQEVDDAEAPLLPPPVEVEPAKTVSGTFAAPAPPVVNSIQATMDADDDDDFTPDEMRT